MSKRFAALCIAFAFLFAPAQMVLPACAADGSLVLVHRVEAFLVGGASDYSVLSPKFQGVFASITGANPVGTGNINFKKSSYTYGTRDELMEGAGTRVSDQDRNFTLKYSSEEEAFCVYKSGAETQYVEFWGDAELGMSQKSFDFTLGGVNTKGTTPKIRSISDQMGSYVPHISLVLDDGKITRIDWKFVNIAGSGAALQKSNLTTIHSVRRINLGLGGSSSRTIDVNRVFAAGELLEGSQYLDTPVEFTPLSNIEIDFVDESNMSGERSSARHIWAFHPLELFAAHTTSAAIYNGISDYSYTDPRFKKIELIMSSGAVTLKDAMGNLTLKDSSYTYGPKSAFESAVAGTVVDNMDASMKLSYSRKTGMLLPGDDPDDPYCFWGTADSGLSGREFTYYLGGMTANGSLPPILSTGEQISRKAVPYVSYVTDGDRVTRLRWRFVDPFRPDEPLVKNTGVSPGWLHGIKVTTVNKKEYVINVDKKFGQGEVMESIADLPEAISKRDIASVALSFYDNGYRDGKNSAVRYDWEFEEKGGDSTGGGGGGGGCSTGAAGFMLLLIALLPGLLKPRLLSGGRAPR